MYSSQPGEDDLLRRIDSAIADAMLVSHAEDPAAQRILEAVEAHLSRGERMPRLASVARQSEIPLSVVRRLFPDPDALIRGHLNLIRALNLQLIRSRVVDTDPADRVTRLIDAFAGWFDTPWAMTEGRHTIELWAGACQAPAVRADFAEVELFWNELLERLIRDEIGEGKVPFTPSNIAGILLACFNGFIVDMTLLGDRATLGRPSAAAAALWQLVKAHCESVDRSPELALRS